MITRSIDDHVNLWEMIYHHTRQELLCPSHSYVVNSRLTHLGSADPKTKNHTLPTLVGPVPNYGPAHQFACNQVLFLTGGHICQTVANHICQHCLTNVALLLSRTRSNCLHANSSSWFTSIGNLSMTGRDIVLTEDSIISAPYCNSNQNAAGIAMKSTLTLTTLELAFPCSYARNAVPTSGK